MLLSPLLSRPAKALALVLFIAGLSACDSQEVAPLNAERPDRVLTQPSGPSSWVRFDELAQAEAVSPFGMLRARPSLDSSGEWLTVHHSRHSPGHGDLELAVRLRQDIGDGQQFARSGPGWFNLGPPDQRILEAAASQHAMRYRFMPATDEATVIRLTWAGNEWSGGFTAPRGRRSLRGTATGAGKVQLHLSLQTSQSFRQARTLPSGAIELTFDPGNDWVEMAVGLSTVSQDNARGNLGAGVFDESFAGVQREARADWDQELSRLTFSGEDALRSRLYRAAYYLLSHYGDLADTDGQYRGAGGELRRVGTDSAYLANLNLAEDYLVLVPMLSLLAPQRMVDLFDTILAHQRTGGEMPSVTRWGQSGQSDALLPALPVLAALVARDLPGLDASKALPPMLRAFMGSSGDWPWDDYRRTGYFSIDVMPRGSVVRTMEASLAHHSVAQVGARLGERELAEAFAVQSLFYRQLFDFDSDLFRGRYLNRDWRSDDGAGGREGVQADFLGQSPADVFWLPGQFDPDGLIGLEDGRQALTERLDRYFQENSDRYQSGLPAPLSWHVPWMYVFSNEPDRGQALIDRQFDAITAQFSDIDNAAGRASQAAWELFVALGLYPLRPSAGEYIVGVPKVSSASIKIGDEELFLERPVVGAEGAKVVGGSFNGTRFPGLNISHRRLASGGTLEFIVDVSSERAGDATGSGE